MPRARSATTSRATSPRTLRAIAAPSISSAGKVHRPRFADDDDLDLAGILELGLDPPRNLLGERRTARVVDVVGHHDDADLPARLDGEYLVDAAIARCDALEPLEAL